MVNTYTEMTTGSRHVAITTAAQIIISKGVKVAWVVAVNRVPPVEVMPGTLEKLDEMQGIQWTKMSSEWRKEMLLQQLDLSGLDGWSWAYHTSAYALLTEYHDIFPLEPGELGCTSLAKHEIKVVDDKPFKQRFWRIPPPMVEEVRAHMKGMLEVGTIHPRQSPWCNAVVLVRKKDGGLHFCIDFCKNDSYPLPYIQEAIWSLVGTGYFSCLDLKVGFLADCHVWSIKTVYSLDKGFFKCECMPFGLCNALQPFRG